MALGRVCGVLRGTQVRVKHSTGSWAAALLLACSATGCTGVRSSTSPNSESVLPIEVESASTPVLSREVTPEELSAVAVFRLVFDTAAGCVAFEDLDTGRRVLPLWPDNIDVVADQLIDDQRSIRGVNGDWFWSVVDSLRHRSKARIATPPESGL